LEASHNSPLWTTLWLHAFELCEIAALLTRTKDCRQRLPQLRRCVRGIDRGRSAKSNRRRLFDKSELDQRSSMALTARPRILVVDDEESVRTFVQRALVDQGYEVAVAADGPKALSVAQQEGPFDLYVIDLILPRMRGDEVARSIRRSAPDAKVLYFTANRDRFFEQTQTLSANEAFLDKPATLTGLLEAVSLLLFG